MNNDIEQMKRQVDEGEAHEDYWIKRLANKDNNQGGIHRRC